MRRLTINLAGLAVLGLTMPAVLAPSIVKAVSSPMGILVPAYFDYSTVAGQAYWSQLNWAADKVPLTVIVAPNSGPGVPVDPGYKAVIDNFRSAGGRAISYQPVHFAPNSGGVSLSDAEAAIANVHSNYNLDGIFVDEMADQHVTADYDYYWNLYNYAKSLNPTWKVFGNENAGGGESDPSQRATTAQGYLHRSSKGYTMDTLNMVEDIGSNYVQWGVMPSWVSNYDRSHFAVILYNTPEDQLQPMLTLAQSRNMGWVCFTDTWSSYMPTYWTEEVTLVAAMNGVILPEPGALGLLGTGAIALIGCYALRRRASRFSTSQ